MSYDNELKGVLFRNENMREGKKDPEYRGNATVGGVDYWLDAWINEKKDGSGKYMALKFRAKEPKPAPSPEQTASADDFNDDIPF